MREILKGFESGMVKQGGIFDKLKGLFKKTKHLSTGRKLPESNGFETFLGQTGPSKNKGINMILNRVNPFNPGELLPPGLSKIKKVNK